VTKIGRNDPCPCGSGKKYKNCCLGKEAQEGEKARADRLMEEIEEQLGDREFGSIEEVNAFLGGFMERKASVPQMDFLGLSSEQVHRMLHAPLESLDDMVRFNHGLEPAAFQEIPVVKNTLLFLSWLQEKEPLKATAKGNLPLAFARELYEAFNERSHSFPHPIRSEQDAVSVNSLRHILKLCGWLKKTNNRYSLTAKGTKGIEKGFSAPHFFTLMNEFVRRFNWGLQDRYASLWIVQGGAVFSLYVLHRKARRFIPAEQLGDYFIRAFPAVLDEVGPMAYWTPREKVSSCFSLRFLVRFCEYFGFVDIRREEKKPHIFELSVKKSAFYDQYITWSAVP